MSLILHGTTWYSTNYRSGNLINILKNKTKKQDPRCQFVIVRLREKELGICLELGVPGMTERWSVATCD